MGRFRIKWGDNEIEYEGQDSDSKFDEAFKRLEGAKQSHTVVRKEEEKETKSARGGVRKGLFAPEIKKLLDEGFFKLPHKKTVAEVQKALEDRGIPVQGKGSQIVTASKRLLRRGLKGTKTPEGWVFWQE